MMTLNRILIGIAPVLVLTMIQDHIHGRKKYKARLALLIPIAVLYTAVGMYLTVRIYHSIEELIQSLSFLSVLRNMLQQRGAWGNTLIVANLLLMILYLLVKWIAGSILKRKWNTPERIELTSSRFYSYDEDYDAWFLQYRWTNYRSLIRVMRWAMVVAAGITLNFMMSTDTTDRMTWIFPCAIVILFNEIYHFINGQTKEEFEYDIDGVDDDSRRFGQFFRLREILENLLPDPLLTAVTGYESEGARRPEKLVRSLSASEDEAERITGEFFAVGNRYMDAETDGIRATLDLMQGRNVVFLDPFYRDLDLYITLPLVRVLASGKKVVIITGRMSAKEDVRAWITGLLAEYTHIPSLWQVRDLGAYTTEGEIGILSFPELYDRRVLQNNGNFIRNTELVLLIEPSAITGTGQVALSILAQELGKGNGEPVYFVCDRMSDGLVDTLSHVLRTEFTEVSAPPMPRCVYTGMTWDADGDFRRQEFFDRQTRYLGDGIELAAVALRNQIPKAFWYGETTVPIRDIKWRAGQYYPVICQYINQPLLQSTLYEKIDFIPNLWSAPKQSEQFAIVEDEFCNMFAAMRNYISRGTSQSFVNILSGNYLLRDYMRCNPQVFQSDPDAVPSLVADYAKTERNTLIKLILLMLRRPVTEQEILDEFHLVGRDSDDAIKLMDENLRRYTTATAEDILVADSYEEQIGEFAIRDVNTYTIPVAAFREHFEKSLSEAFYLVEQETGGTDFVDARFFSLVTQSILPGQFVTYDGKYYRVHHISPQTGVVLRRASDLFNGRRYYRQIREYTITTGDDVTLSSRNVDGLEFSFIRRNIHVSTTGYLDMSDAHDLKTAVMVDLTGDPMVKNYSRDYRNKTILRIRLPETGADERFTLCLLLSEAFRTIFPDTWPFLAVTTVYPEDCCGLPARMMYPLHGEVEDGCIYFIEDSDIDLGLTGAVERNWNRMMEILADYIDWHLDKMVEPEASEPVPPSYEYDKNAAPAKEGRITRLLRRIRRRFTRVKAEPATFETSDFAREEKDHPAAEREPRYEGIAPGRDSAASAAGAEAADGTDREETTRNDAESVNSDEEGNAFGKEENALHDGATPDGKQPDPAGGTGITTETGRKERKRDADGSAADGRPLPNTRYTRECFLKFGDEEFDDHLRLDGLFDYLKSHGWADNTLTQARKRNPLDKQYLDTDAVNHCDFCGRPLSGVSYEMLTDGRIRCNDCSASAITTVEEFRELFTRTLELMGAIYNIQFRVPIGITTADAKTVAKGTGKVFRPSTEYTRRVVGYAQKKKDRYTMVIENGSPRLCTIETIVHEMTHIWQYRNWDDEAFASAYNMGSAKKNAIARDLVYEGMAGWASIQYLYQVGETRYAAEAEAGTTGRKDVYGVGYRLFREQYPLLKESAILRVTPYGSFPPVDPERVRELLAEVE